MTRETERLILELREHTEEANKRAERLGRLLTVQKPAATKSVRGNSATKPVRKNSKTPWYRKQKGTWYAWVGGSQVSLGVRGAGNEAAACAALAESRRSAPARAAPVAEPAPVQVTVSELASAFLADARDRVKSETLCVWRSALKRLGKQFGARAVASLKVFEVEQFARGVGKSSSTANTFLTSVVTCFRWGVRAGVIDANPLAGIRKPPHASRGAKAALTGAQFEALCDASPPHFRAFLRGLWLTGCRPGELERLTVADVDFGTGVAALAEHKTSNKTSTPRLIFLSPEALALFRGQVREGGGHLFLNSWGNPWNRFTTQKAMAAARKKAKVPHAICYGMRHSYATAALVKGVPDATVATLLGHSGTAMLHKHYSHLTSQTAVMRAAAAQVHESKEEPPK